MSVNYFYEDRFCLGNKISKNMPLHNGTYQVKTYVLFSITCNSSPFCPYHIKERSNMEFQAHYWI